VVTEAAAVGALPGRSIPSPQFGLGAGFSRPRSPRLQSLIPCRAGMTSDATQALESQAVEPDKPLEYDAFFLEPIVIGWWPTGFRRACNR
jgi:hypothetical protein